VEGTEIEGGDSQVGDEVNADRTSVRIVVVGGVVEEALITNSDQVIGVN
jgi:hypothetical protein